MSAASSPLSDPPPSPNPIEVRKISPARKSVGDVQMNTEAPHRSGHVDRTDSEHQTAARSSHRPPNKRRRTRSASIAEQGDSRAERESAAGQSHNTGREYERPDYGPPTPTSAGIPPGTDGRGRFSRDDFTGHLYPDYWPRPPQPRDWAAGSARPRPPPPAAIDAIKAQKGKRRNSGSGSAIEPPTPMSASAKGSSRAAEESTEIGASRGRVSSSSSEQMASSKQAARQRSGKEQSTSRRPSGNLAQPVKAVNGKEEASSEVDELADDGERSEWDEATDDESVPLAMLARSRKAASSGRAGLQEAVVAMSRDLAASKAVRDKGQSSAGNPVERASGTEPRPHRGPSNEGNQPDEGKAGEMSASRRVPVQELEISQSEGSPVGASSQQQGEPSSGWHDGRRPSGEAPSPVLNIGKDERMRKYEEDRRKYEEDRQRIRSGRATTDLDVSGQSAAQSIDPSRKRQVSGSGNEQLAKSTQPSPVSSRRPDHARDEMQQRRQVVEQRGSRHNSPRLPPRDPKSGRDPGCDLTLEEGMSRHVP